MQNYAQQLAATLSKIEKQISLGGKKPSLLLHACCAPCSSYVLEYLGRFFEITIYYYNPNIHPETEYTRRLEELKNFLPKFCDDKDISTSLDMTTQIASTNAERAFQLIEATYIPQEFFDATNAARDGLENEAERGERCRRCYKLRMEHSYNYAVQNNFDWFTTTLSISPHKDAQKINEIGLELEAALNGGGILQAGDMEQPHTKYLAADFKKQNGFKRSLELSKQYGLYRQDYCGCVYSLRKQLFGELRPMQEHDIPQVLALMAPFVEKGYLLPRSSQTLKSQLHNYIVYNLNGVIHACASLKEYDGVQAEIYSVAVEETHSNMGVGPRMVNFLLERAKETGAKSVFILTTHADDFFQKLGFVPDSIDSIPPERKAIWTPERGSRVFRKNLR